MYKGEALSPAYGKKIQDDGFQRTSQGRGGGGSRKQTRLEITWELAPFLRVLLSRRANKGSYLSLYLGLGLASYIDLENIWIGCSAD